MKVLKASSLLSAIACVSGMLTAGTAMSATIVSEDFESYTDTADLGGTWSLGDGTLDTGFGNPGQSLSHPGTGGSFTGANTNSLTFGEVSPTATDILVFKADIYDDGSIENNRTTAGLRKASGANIIEMGMYNSPSHYAFRTVLFGAGTSGWVAFDNLVDDAGAPISNQAFAGWHTFTAKISDTEILFELDLNGDGNINATATEAISLNPAGGFDIIRLGGPSDLGSAGGGVSFDNVSLESVTIPEPSTTLLALVALGALASRRKA